MKRITVFAITCILLCLFAVSGGAAENPGVPVETSRLGVMVGSTNEKYAQQHYPNAKLEHFNNYVDSTAALKAGKLDYAMMDYASALNFIKYNPGLKLASDFLTDEKYCIGINKNNPELAEKISGVLDRYLADGTMDEIISHWVKEDGSSYTLAEVPKHSDAPVLKAATVSSREPTAFLQNGQYTGMEMELVERIAYELGYRVEYLDMEFSAMVTAMGSGKADICTAMYKTPERAEKILFTAPYFPNPQVLITNDVKDTSPNTAKIAEFLDRTGQSFHRTFIVENRWRLVFSGLRLTILISLLSMLLGSLLGALVCIMNRSRIKFLSAAAKLYIRVIQGMPIVVMLMIFYYIIFGNVNIDAVIVAVVAFSLNFSAYTSEIFRTGVNAVDKGQLEAAAASGFSGVQSFLFITLPQAARHIIPVYKGEFISMVKMTSVVGYIAIQDLTKASDIIRSRTYEAFFPLIAVALMYFAITYLFILILNIVEYKIDPKRRKRAVRRVIIHD